VADEGIKLIAKNKKASFDYHVEEALEAGIVLSGTEVKALRDGKAQLTDAYAMIERGEVYVFQLHISEYSNKGYANHEAKRTRKLLLHRAEIARLERKVTQKGVTLIPLELYFKRGKAKLKLGLCRGKKLHDKRATIKQRDLERDERS